MPALMNFPRKRKEISTRVRSRLSREQRDNLALACEDLRNQQIAAYPDTFVKVQMNIVRDVRGWGYKNIKGQVALKIVEDREGNERAALKYGPISMPGYGNVGLSKAELGEIVYTTMVKHGVALEWQGFELVLL